MRAAKDDGRLRTATLEIDDTGLLAKVLPAIAREQGTTAEALVAMSVSADRSLRRGPGAPTLKALDGVVSFITDWKQPKGPIKIAITAGQDAGIADLEKVVEPKASPSVRPDGRLRGNACRRGDRRTAGRRAGTRRPAGSRRRQELTAARPG